MRRGLILLRPDADGGAAGAAGDGEAKPKAADDVGKQDADEKATGGDTFTSEQQAKIDAMVAERVKRAEAAARKKALEEAEAERKKAAMDESERLKAEKAEAEQRASEAQAERDRVIIEAEAKVTALAAGVAPDRLERVLRLLDLSGIEISEGKLDAPAVTSAVEQLKGEIPELFGAGPAKRSGGDFSGDGGAKRSFTRAEIAAMEPKEYAENRDAILAAQREGRIRD